MAAGCVGREGTINRIIKTIEHSNQECKQILGVTGGRYFEADSVCREVLRRLSRSKFDVEIIECRDPESTFSDTIDRNGVVRLVYVNGADYRPSVLEDLYEISSVRFILYSSYVSMEYGPSIHIGDVGLTDLCEWAYEEFGVDLSKSTKTLSTNPTVLKLITERARSYDFVHLEDLFQRWGDLIRPKDPEKEWMAMLNDAIFFGMSEEDVREALLAIWISPHMDRRLFSNMIDCGAFTLDVLERMGLIMSTSMGYRLDDFVSIIVGNGTIGTAPTETFERYVGAMIEGRCPFEKGVVFDYLAFVSKDTETERLGEMVRRLLDMGAFRGTYEECGPILEGLISSVRDNDILSRLSVEYFRNTIVFGAGPNSPDGFITNHLASMLADVSGRIDGVHREALILCNGIMKFDSLDNRKVNNGALLTLHREDQALELLVDSPYAEMDYLIMELYADSLLSEGYGSLGRVSEWLEGYDPGRIRSEEDIFGILEYCRLIRKYLELVPEKNKRLLKRLVGSLREVRAQLSEANDAYGPETGIMFSSSASVELRVRLETEWAGALLCQGDYLRAQQSVTRAMRFSKNPSTVTVARLKECRADIAMELRYFGDAASLYADAHEGYKSSCHVRESAVALAKKMGAMAKDENYELGTTGVELSAFLREHSGDMPLTALYIKRIVGDQI